MTPAASAPTCGGPPWDPAWKRNDPLKQVAKTATNNTRLWIYCAPGGQTELDVNADPSQQFNANSLESMAIKGNKDFQGAYVKAGGHNATFNFPASGNHSWPYWGAQLTALKPDLIATLTTGGTTSGSTGAASSSTTS
jgi:diacylglycerol O-acyltransferase / trehalose O-mycolyltransferase